jgi:hypothetical protein
LLLLGGVVARAGTASWTIQPTANPSGGLAATLSGVACPSSTSCVGVGSYVNHAGTPVTLAEVRNGSHWTMQRTPNPLRATDSYLSAVACASRTACTAVGYYDTNYDGTDVDLVEVGNGSHWTIQPAPIPSGSLQSQLSDVVCTSANHCVAVGYYLDRATNFLTLVEVWNGSRWTIQSSPNSVGAGDNTLSGVDCVSPTVCVAVGNYVSNAGEVTLVERWDGSHWVIQPSPNPVGAKDSFLSAVSCSSSSACTAVGVAFRRTGGSAQLVEIWNGSGWTIQTTPTLAGASRSNLNAVSCISQNVCTAVGTYRDRAGTNFSLAEGWNGVHWSIQPTPIPAGATTGSYLSGVACSSSIECTAVGVRLSGGTNFLLAESRTS